MLDDARAPDRLARRGFLGRCGAGLGTWALAARAAAVSGGVADAHGFNAKLGRGINLGNGLEAPSEGAWGFRLEAAYFPAIKRAGFQTVRIPVRWSTHAGTSAPFTIDAAFLDRVVWAVDQALGSGLNAMVNFHHIEELYANPKGERARFLGMWEQVAKRFASYPEALVFEVLNEPHGQLDDAEWASLWPRALRTIRETNPDRYVVLGPAQWNNLSKLESLKLPEADRRLIATFHYYSPFEFTHQGAEWAEGSEQWLGRTWTATPEQRAAVERDFDKVATWSKRNGRPVFLGEFGAYRKADMRSRALWSRTIARASEARGFSWCYWEFGSGFGAYDPSTRQWREPLLHALVPPQGTIEGARS